MCKLVMQLAWWQVHESILQHFQLSQRHIAPSAHLRIIYFALYKYTLLLLLLLRVATYQRKSSEVDKKT